MEIDTIGIFLVISLFIFAYTVITGSYIALYNFGHGNYSVEKNNYVNYKEILSSPSSISNYNYNESLNIIIENVRSLLSNHCKLWCDYSEWR
jgi:hypothetical protein